MKSHGTVFQAEGTAQAKTRRWERACCVLRVKRRQVCLEGGKEGVDVEESGRGLIT